jgi:hypothetical protein
MDSILNMRETNVDKIKYDTEIKQDSNIQGFLGLQGFDYGY